MQGFKGKQARQHPKEPAMPSFILPFGAAARRLAIPLMLITASGCGGRSNSGDVEPEPEYDQDTPVSLSVANSHWLDVTIFVFHDGEMSRVGLVTAASNGSFSLPPWMLGQTRNIRLLADPVGSEGWIRSETIHVQPGQSIEWRLESQLARSTVMVY
jgi:hypothetical protein